jgi:hypothetical protein
MLFLQSNDAGVMIILAIILDLRYISLLQISKNRLKAFEEREARVATPLTGCVYCQAAGGAGEAE